MTPPKPASRALVPTERDLAGASTEGLAEEQRIMELSLQRVTDRQENHEKACLDNQRRIEMAFSAVNGRLDKIDTGLTNVVTAQTANAAVAAAAITNAKPKWWMQVLGGAVVALIGWMGSTIWSMENAKVEALQRQPAAAVTVNPAQPVPTTAPAPIPVSPPSSAASSYPPD